MMEKRIFIIQGHPDSGQQQLCHSQYDAYIKVATQPAMKVDEQTGKSGNNGHCISMHNQRSVAFVAALTN